MARNVAGAGRHYVSARLVRETGVTMQALRACNWLYVRRKLIASGELDDNWLPTYWSQEWTAQVLAVLAVVDPRRGPPAPGHPAVGGPPRGAEGAPRGPAARPSAGVERKDARARERVVLRKQAEVLETIGAGDLDAAAVLLAADAEVVTPNGSHTGSEFLALPRDWPGLDNLDISIRERVFTEEEGVVVSRATRVFSWKGVRRGRLRAGFLAVCSRSATCVYVASGAFVASHSMPSSR
jgi:hypothetical protein